MDTVKIIHLSCAFLSISGFIGRGWLMIKDSPLLQARWIKISPHLIDTVLLLSAIILVSQWGWAVLKEPWLVAKIIALLVYIGLGMLALRDGRTKGVRIVAWMGAIAVFAYIVAAAVCKTPLLFWCQL